MTFAVDDGGSEPMIRMAKPRPATTQAADAALSSWVCCEEIKDGFRWNKILVHKRFCFNTGETTLIRLIFPAFSFAC